MKLITFFIFCLIILSGCKHPNNNKETKRSEKNTSLSKVEDKLFPSELFIEQYITQKKELKLSNFTDNIRYVALKTPPSVIISSIRKILNYNNNIFIKSKTGIFQFDLNGNFIREFSNKGKGPEEYIYVSDFDIDETKEELLICGSHKILFFDINNGNYKKRINIRTDHISVCDSIICCTRESLGLEKVLMIVINSKGDTLSVIPNYNLYRPKRRMIVGSVSKIAYSFYKNNGNTYFRGEEDNDTVWQVGTNGIIPYYILNFGKYKLPLVAYPGVNWDKFRKEGGNYLGAPRMMEDNRYIYLTIAPRISDQLFTQTIVFDKTADIGYSVSNLNKPGIRDDILNGPNFWPYNVTKDYYFSTIEAFELLEYYDNNGTNVRPELKEILSQLELSSNSLIILCKRKNI